MDNTHQTEEEFEYPYPVLLDSVDEVYERVEAYMGLRDSPEPPLYYSTVTAGDQSKLDVSPFPEPGMQVEIEYTNGFVDGGYFFQLPGLRGDPHNITVLHIPDPGPPSKGGPVPVWTHLMDALAMMDVVQIRGYF